MRIVIDFSQLENAFIEGWIQKADEQPKDDPMRPLLDAAARALVKERDRRGSRPRGNAAKSFRIPLEAAPTDVVFRLQKMTAGLQFELAERDFHHGAVFCSAISLAAGEHFLRQSLH